MSFSSQADKEEVPFKGLRTKNMKELRLEASKVSLSMIVPVGLPKGPLLSSKPVGPSGLKINGLGKKINESLSHSHSEYAAQMVRSLTLKQFITHRLLSSGIVVCGYFFIWCALMVALSVGIASSGCKPTNWSVLTASPSWDGFLSWITSSLIGEEFYSQVVKICSGQPSWVKLGIVDSLSNILIESHALRMWIPVIWWLVL